MTVSCFSSSRPKSIPGAGADYVVFLKVSFATLAEHNRDDDCWVAVHGNVYDVTKFLSEHPGGAAALSKPGRAGSDVTSHFERIGHSAEARARLLTIPLTRGVSRLRRAAADRAALEERLDEQRATGPRPAIDGRAVWKMGVLALSSAAHVEWQAHARRACRRAILLVSSPAIVGILDAVGTIISRNRVLQFKGALVRSLHGDVASRQQHCAHDANPLCICLDLAEQPCKETIGRRA